MWIICFVGERSLNADNNNRQNGCSARMWQTTNERLLEPFFPIIININRKNITLSTHRKLQFSNLLPLLAYMCRENITKFTNAIAMTKRTFIFGKLTFFSSSSSLLIEIVRVFSESSMKHVPSVLTRNNMWASAAVYCCSTQIAANNKNCKVCSCSEVTKTKMQKLKIAEIFRWT